MPEQMVTNAGMIEDHDISEVRRTFHHYKISSGITWKAMADRSGVNQTTITRFVNNQSNLSLGMYQKILAHHPALSEMLGGQAKTPKKIDIPIFGYMGQAGNNRPVHLGVEEKQLIGGCDTSLLNGNNTPGQRAFERRFIVRPPMPGESREQQVYAGNVWTAHDSMMVIKIHAPLNIGYLDGWIFGITGDVAIKAENFPHKSLRISVLAMVQVGSISMFGHVQREEQTGDPSDRFVIYGITSALANGVNEAISQKMPEISGQLAPWELMMDEINAIYPVVMAAPSGYGTAGLEIEPVDE